MLSSTWFQTSCGALTSEKHDVIHRWSSLFSTSSRVESYAIRVVSFDLRSTMIARSTFYLHANRCYARDIRVSPAQRQPAIASPWVIIALNRPTRFLVTACSSDVSGSVAAAASCAVRATEIKAHGESLMPRWPGLSPVAAAAMRTTAAAAAATAGRRRESETALGASRWPCDLRLVGDCRPVDSAAPDSIHLNINLRRPLFSLISSAPSQPSTPILSSVALSIRGSFPSHDSARLPRAIPSRRSVCPSYSSLHSRPSRIVSDIRQNVGGTGETMRLTANVLRAIKEPPRTSGCGSHCVQLAHRANCVAIGDE